jgi:hypothetical protein
MLLQGTAPVSAKLWGVTYSPCIAAKNHQLDESFSFRDCIAPTAFAYHKRSVLARVPPLFHASARINLGPLELLLELPLELELLLEPELPLELELLLEPELPLELELLLELG